MIIDTHCHMHGKEFAADFDDVLARATDAGVGRIALIGCDLDDSRRALERAQGRGEFLAVVGVHPHAASTWSATVEKALREELLPDPATVAVGEIGLDYHYDFSPQRDQHTALLAQLALANEFAKPIVVHCREAYEDILSLFRDFYRHVPPPPDGPRGVMHCYFGTPAQAGAFAELGFVLGIGGSVTFNKAEELRDVVRSMPLDTLVLETDAPYMAPVPHRGKRNEPAHLPLVVARIAELKGVEPEEVIASTTRTAKALFRLSD